MRAGLSTLLDMPRQGRRAIGVVIAAAVLFAAGCGGGGGGGGDGGGNSGASSGDSAETGGTPAPGGTLTYAIRAIQPRLDPAINQMYAFTESPPMNAIFGNLMYEDAGTNEVKMGFLESFEGSDDFKVWTAKLRSGLKFSDDTPFDAEAIAFNIRRAADPETGSIFRALAQKLELDVVDATTLTITLRQPDAEFPTVFMKSFPFVGSPTAIKEMGSDYSTKPVGAGPFKIESSVQGQTLTLVKNPNFALYQKAQPYLDKLVFQGIPDYGQQRAAVASNTAQVAYASGERDVAAFEKEGLNSWTIRTGGGGNFMFNTTKPPFDNPIARRAVCLALDRKTLAEAFAPGTPPATNLFPKSSPFYDEKYNLPTQNREEAQKLFDQLAAEGKPLSFSHTLPSEPDPLNTGNLVQSQLATYENVKMKVNAVPNPVFKTAQRTGDFELSTGGLYMLDPVPDLSEYLRTDGSGNMTGWSEPSVDDAVNTVLTTTDEAEQKAAWATVQEEFLDGCPIYFVNEGVIGFAATKEITGVHLVGLGLVPQFGEIGYAEK
jgi:peptide/nickel transport system substrate-binding protein